MKTITTFIIVMVLMVAEGCSGDQSGTGEHVWKEQTEALKKAEQVEEQILKQAEEQKKLIEQQTR